MLILASDGLTSENVISKFKSVIKGRGSNLKAAVVTTAASDEKENADSMPYIKDFYKKLNISMKCIDIDKDNCEQLLDYDIIEFIGGDPFYLLNSMIKCGCKAVLKKINDAGKIIIGWSAGAFVLQDNMELVSNVSPEMNEKIGLTDFTAMELTTYEIFPHYQWMITAIKGLEDIICSYEKKSHKKVYRLRDGEALFISESNAEFIASK